MDGPTIASEPSRDTHDHVKSRLEPKMESRQLHRTYRGMLIASSSSANELGTDSRIYEQDIEELPLLKMMSMN